MAAIPGGAFGNIATINPAPISSIVGTHLNAADVQTTYTPAETNNLLTLLNHYNPSYILKSFRTQAGYNDEFGINLAIWNLLSTPIPGVPVVPGAIHTEYIKFIRSIISFSINTQHFSIIQGKLIIAAGTFVDANNCVPVIIMRRLGLNKLLDYDNNPARAYDELTRGSITFKTFLDLVNKFNFLGTFIATTDSHFGNIMFTDKFIQELNIIDLGLSRNVIDTSSVRLSNNDLRNRINNNLGFDNFSIEDVIHDPIHDAANPYTKAQIITFLEICHRLFRGTCAARGIYSPYFSNHNGAAFNQAAGDASFNTSIGLIYDEFTAMAPLTRHYRGMRTKDLYIFGMWIIFNRRLDLFSDTVLMEHIGAILMHPHPVLRPNTDALKKFLNQVIKPSRDTVNISVNYAGVEHNLCTVENRIEGTVNFNISGLLQNIGPHINQRFHATTIQWNTISYTSLIVQLYSIFRDQTPNKLVSMSIIKARHLRVQGIPFEYTFASMQTLVNNLTLAELGRMEDAVIVECRQRINTRTPWIVNQDPIRNTFINAASAWSPALPHNGGVAKVIGPGAGGVIAI